MAGEDIRQMILRIVAADGTIDKCYQEVRMPAIEGQEFTATISPNEISQIRVAVASQEVPFDVTDHTIIRPTLT